MIKVGIVGIGQFAPNFIRLFQAHPGVEDVYVCDVVEERLLRAQREWSVGRLFDSYEEMLESDVDAVAIFTQRWLHGPMTLAALRRGKHVYSAVPIGTSVEEIEEILQTVSETGLTYMTGETSYFYPAVMFCRDQWRAGAFGHFVYGEGEYLHDMTHGFYEAYQYSGGEQWKRTASFPPMYYPSHSLSSVLSVTDASVTSVSCVGFVDREGDGVFDRAVSDWDNDFSNETALFATSDGGSIRVNEFRRVGKPRAQPDVRLSLFGTQAVFEQQTGASVWQTRDGFRDVTAELLPLPAEHAAADAALARAGVAEDLRKDFQSGFAPVHDTSELPSEFDGMPNGHQGSHQFLVHDFVQACEHGVRPGLSAWAAARYTVPGLLAHRSAREGGTRIAVPVYGPR